MTEIKPDSNQHLQAAIETLSGQLAEASREQRYLRRRLGRINALLGLLLGVALLGGTLVMTGHSQPAQAGLAGDLEQSGKQLDQAAKAEFDQFMESLRHDVKSAENFNPGKTIAVILHDMQLALQAMPAMAKDMREMNAKMSSVPVMADQMGQMNWKMGIIAHDIDSTMGRMGRMMPW